MMWLIYSWIQYLLLMMRKVIEMQKAIKFRLLFQQTIKPFSKVDGQQQAQKDGHDQKDKQNQKDNEESGSQQKKGQDQSQHYVNMFRSYRDQFVSNLRGTKININQQHDLKNKQQQQKDNQQQKDSEQQKDTEQQQKDGEQQKDSEQGQEHEQKLSLREQLKEKLPIVSKVVEGGIYCWRLTFPDPSYQEKYEKAKQEAKRRKEEEQNIKEYTEEELQEMDEKIPEWKKGAMELKQEEKKESLRQQMKGKLKDKFNETKFAKNAYQSEQYKQYTDFKKEAQEFKQDLKDHLENSQSKTAQIAIATYSVATNESGPARATRRMREIDPDFDTWKFEDESKAIFLDNYGKYLKGDLGYLEESCSESALGYFKVMLKKQEAEKMEPKFKELVTSEKTYLESAYVHDNNMPVFVFRVRVQEIYCMVSKKDGSIVDGDESRIIGSMYEFALTPSFEMDIEKVGHYWQMIECQPREQQQLLV